MVRVFNERMREPKLVCSTQILNQALPGLGNSPSPKEPLQNHFPKGLVFALITPIMDKDAWVRRQHLSWDNPSGDK